MQKKEEGSGALSVAHTWNAGIANYYHILP